jgi:biotin carboxylase
VRVVLLLPTSTYRAADFLAAARELGADVVVASDRLSPTARTDGVHAVEVPLDDADAAADAIVALDQRGAIDAVIPVDDQGVVVAARAAQRLGLPHNPPEAAAATRDKRALRAALAGAEVPQPRFAAVDDLDDLPDVGFP